MRGAERRVFDACEVRGGSWDRRGGAAVTAVAVDAAARRLFIGLADGMLEEYMLPTAEERAGDDSDAPITASLVARKPVTARVALAALLPAPAAAALAVLAADGALRLLHWDTFEGRVVAKDALAAAVGLPDGGAPPRLAVAARAAGRRGGARLAAHELLAAGGRAAALRPLWEVDLGLAPGAGVNALAWAGAGVVVVAGARVLVAGAGGARELLVAPGSDEPPPRALALPPALALVLVGGLGLLVDGRGEPVGAPLPLEGLPPVKALAAAAGFAVAVCEGGAYVLDPSAGGGVVQFLAVGGAGAPGAFAAAAGGGGAADGLAVVAGARGLAALAPRPPAARARELLARGDYAGAAALEAAAAAAGDQWAEEAAAQAALLLLGEGRVAEAVAAAARCGAAALQPAELLPLFPTHAAGLAARPPPPHWGLHKPLGDLEALLERRLSGAQAGARGRASAPPAVGTNGAKARGAALSEARQSVVEYLFRARALDGAEDLEAVDTLLLHLLIDAGAASEAAALAAARNSAAAAPLAPRLRAAGWHAALAALLAAGGDAAGALEQWRQVAAGELEPGDGSSDGRRAAAEAAAALARDAATCPAPDALAALPWLLDAAPEAALGVLGARALPRAEALPLLRRGSEARWRFLEHAAAGEGAEEEAVHTELVLALIDALLEAAPRLRDEDGEDGGAAVAPRPTSAKAPSGGGTFSAAALVSGGPPDTDAAAGDAALALRLRLRACLEAAPRRWDATAVGASLARGALAPERFVAAAALGDHAAALRVAALELRDVGAAVAYAAARVPPREHRTLLRLVLAPGGGAPPRWADAAHAVAALGGSLDPLELLAELPPEMPLAAAAPLLAPLLRERGHRRRAAQVEAALRRAALARAAVARAAAAGGRVAVDEARACPRCRLRLGGKVFVVVPGSGGGGAPEVLCFACHRRGGGAAAPAEPGVGV
jgi:hypothetical protein